MVLEKELKKNLIELNPWWGDKFFRYKVLPRENFDFFNKKKSGLIDIFIGARRVGKTSIMKGIVNSLLDEGIKARQIVYFVTDSRISKDVVPEDIVSFVQENFKLKKEKIYLFLDEVQDMNDWQRGVKYLYDNLNTKIYISGSSSLILRPETSKLTGRFFLHEVLVLSFKEYLDFKKKSLYKSRKRNIDLVTEYLQTGGYPEYVLTGDKHLLTNIIESTLYRDLVSHYGIRNPAFLKDLFDYLIDKVTNVVSNQGISRDLKVNDDTAKFYLKYLEDVYLIHPVYKESRSHRVTKGSLPKYYINDTGVLNFRSFSPKIGALAENAVFLHLKRKSFSKEVPEIYYSQQNGVVIDFEFEKKEFFEVKFRDSLEWEDVEKYQLVEKKIKFIVKEKTDVLNNWESETLDQFLIS